MSFPEKEYPATLGVASRIISALVILFFVGQFFFLSYKNSLEPRKEFAFAVAFMLFMLLLPLITFAYRPKKYSLNNEYFCIHRIAGSYRIPISVIKEIIRADNSDMRLTFRTFGNGGLFGYTGYFRNSKFGKMRWFVSQRNNYIVIETRDGSKFVVSPDEPEQLIADLQQAISDR